MVNFVDEDKKYRPKFNEDQLKRVVYHRRSVSPLELVLVKHPKSSEGWYAVHIKSKRAFEIFADIEEVEDVPLWKVPGYEGYDPSLPGN